ncbi:MAG TPA: isochorismatase family cysteine hydrolase [Rhizomicrobium sp.]|nr:isochorismatase family cysteine hydrolase [Rhizomicrobium sp.]
MPDKLDPKTTALLVMDFQTLIVEGFAEGNEGLLDRTARLIGAARNADVRVVYVVVGFREGHPEISLRNPSFGPIRSSGMFAPGAPGTGIHPAVAPQQGEVVVTKHRVGAFTGTDLDMVLRANGIDTLVLAGIATSGVVLSTLRHAADADYQIVVAADCCSDRDAEVHRVLLEKVFPRQAKVVNCAEIISSLQTSR